MTVLEFATKLAEDMVKQQTDLAAELLAKNTELRKEIKELKLALSRRNS